MKYVVFIAVACSMAFLASCSKDDSVAGPDGLVKTIDSFAMDPNIGLIPLDDGQYVIVSDGRLIKLDDKGNIVWKKPITEISKTYAAAADPGYGFVLFGEPVNPPTQASFYACRYDREGNLVETKQVNLNFERGFVEPPLSMIRLSNGGFAIAMSSSFTWSIYLKILDHDFNVVHSRAFLSFATDWAFLVRNICELPGGDLAMAATVSYGDNNTSYMNASVLLTGPDGTLKSIFTRRDSVINQVPQVVSPWTGGFFAVTTSMSGWLSNNGTFVNYYGGLHYYGGTQLAGTMQIDQFNEEGHFTGSSLLTGYSGYGLIKSIHPTPDGGFLLCGTAGNNGSPASVSMTKVFVCKLDAGLHQEWSKMFTTNYQAIGTDAVPTSDGGCLVAGNLKSFGNTYRMLMIRTDANGNY